MAKARVKLLHGDSPDIVSANINSLKGAGYSHKHATHLSLKHARKGMKKLNTVAMKVAKKDNTGGFNV